MKWKADQADWTEVDHTEVVHDNLDPRYEHHFDVVYNFGQKVQLRFECNDIDSDNKTDFIGSCEVDLATLVKTSSGTGHCHNLGDKCGDLRLICTETTKAKEKIKLDLQAYGMPSCNNIWAF